MKTLPTCRPRTTSPSLETHRPEGEPQGLYKGTRQQWDTAFSGAVQVLPRSDFQTTFPKGRCLEGVPGERGGAPYSNVTSAALFIYFVIWQIHMGTNLKNSCAAEKLFL